LEIFNPLNVELNPICHLLALLGAHHIFYVSGLRVNLKFGNEAQALRLAVNKVRSITIMTACYMLSCCLVEIFLYMFYPEERDGMFLRKVATQVSVYTVTVSSPRTLQSI